MIVLLIAGVGSGSLETRGSDDGSLITGGGGGSLEAGWVVVHWRQGGV